MHERVALNRQNEVSSPVGHTHNHVLAFTAVEHAMSNCVPAVASKQSRRSALEVSHEIWCLHVSVGSLPIDITRPARHFVDYNLLAPSSRRTTIVGKIAVVDDDSDFVDLLAIVLGDAGHIVVTCTDSDNCYPFLRQELPDLVIIDMQTDKPWNGIQVLTALRMGVDTRHIPVIICTGLTPQDLEDYEDRLQLFHAQVLYKPFGIDKLNRLVGESLVRA